MRTCVRRREDHISLAPSLDVFRAVKGLELLVEAHPNLEDRHHLLRLAMTAVSLMVAVYGQAVLECGLESLLHPRHSQEPETPTEVALNVEELRRKDTKEWVFEEMEAVIHLLIAQVKPFMSVVVSSLRNKA